MIDGKWDFAVVPAGRVQWRVHRENLPLSFLRYVLGIVPQLVRKQIVCTAAYRRLRRLTDSGNFDP